jgi:hypothetical protein
VLKRYESADNVVQGKGKWDVYSNIFGGPAQAQQQEYDHTYGSHDKENTPYPQYHPHPNQSQYQQEAEYYDSPSHPNHSQEQFLPEQIHRETNTTQDMLSLDRFAGGLGYGYEPGYGLGGSAGIQNSRQSAGRGRKGVEVAGRWGVRVKG